VRIKRNQNRVIYPLRYTYSRSREIAALHVMEIEKRNREGGDEERTNGTRYAAY